MIKEIKPFCNWCKKEISAYRLKYTLIYTDMYGRSKTYYFCNRPHLINFLLNKKLPQKKLKPIAIKMSVEDVKKAILSKEIKELIKEDIQTIIFSKEFIDNLIKILKTRL
jgi:YHS domain-containing protein